MRELEDSMRRVSSVDIRGKTSWLAGLVETMDAVACEHWQAADPDLRDRVIAHLSRSVPEFPLVPAAPRGYRARHVLEDAER